jgi:hypothetical protein
MWPENWAHKMDGLLRTRTEYLQEEKLPTIITRPQRG